MFQFGTREKRFDPKDILEFVEIQKQAEQFKLEEIMPIRKKVKSKMMNIDFQKKKINLEMNRVV